MLTSVSVQDFLQLDTYVADVVLVPVRGALKRKSVVDDLLGIIKYTVVVRALPFWWLQNGLLEGRKEGLLS